MLHASQVESVLEGFGLTDRPSADLSGLSRIYDAWCRHVPFDNARKMVAVRAGSRDRLPGDDPAEFFDAWLAHRVGGTCWAGNGALCELLLALGFDARRGVATMMVAPNLPPNHGTVLVELPEGRYVVDASILFVEPLAVTQGRESAITHGAWGVRGHWLDDGKYAIHWRALPIPEPFNCRIDESPVDATRFRAQHEATREWSPFNYELTFTLVRGEARIGIAHGQAVRIEADGSFTATPLEDRMAFLVDELGVSETLAAQIPEDVPVPPPPGSNTAAMANQSRQ